MKTENKAYKTLSYTKADEEKFPDFNDEELIKYIKGLGYPKYADFIKNPIYGEGSKQWWTGFSKISIKITGFDKNNNKIEKIINFDVPMGC